MTATSSKVDLVLVTGAGGFLGLHCVAGLLEEGRGASGRARRSCGRVGDDATRTAAEGSNARLREVLGIEPRPGPEAAVAMATSLIELGAV